MTIKQKQDNLLKKSNYNPRGHLLVDIYMKNRYDNDNWRYDLNDIRIRLQALHNKAQQLVRRNN